MRAAAQAALVAVDALEAQERADDAGLSDEEANESLFGGSSEENSMYGEDEEGSPAPAAAGQDIDVSSVASMNVPQLKLLLTARGGSTHGNKAALADRLAAIISAAAAAAGGDAEEPEAPRAAAKGGRGGGKGGGRAGSGARGKGGGKGGRAGAPATAAAPRAEPKYKWVDLDQHTFTPRAAWSGEELPTLGEELADLKWDDAPEKWYAKFAAPQSEFELRAANSEKYRDYRHGHDMDGPGKRSYDGATKITVADMHMLDAFILLAGLDPAVSREKIFDGNRLAIIGHRGAQLLNEERMKVLRKFHHPSNAFEKKAKGQPGYDNLHQVWPMLYSLQNMCRSKKLIVNGKEKSADEETLGSQCAAADNLKQNSDRYKAAGDGLQADCVCLRGGSLKAFAFRNHSLLPKVSVKGRPDIKLSETHARTLWVFYLSGMESGSEVGLDNLYNSVDFSWMLEAGVTLVFDIPAGWMADVLGDGDMRAKRIEWEIKGVHIVGTLRGNRGAEKAYQSPDKMGKAVEEALREQPLIPDRVKVRVTDDKAQVITIAIFDKKGFQMIDTVHSAVELEEKSRRVFDKARGKPGNKMVPISNAQNLYNKIMGFVDLDDLLAWFYRCDAKPEPGA